MIEDDGPSQKNSNRFTKTQLFRFDDPLESWEHVGEDWFRWSVPVYRKPQSDWAETEITRKQKIWFAEKTFSADATDPNEIDFPPWLQCYWDAQAGRWVVIPSQGRTEDTDKKIAIIKTGASGIPERVGVVAGKAACAVYGIDETDELYDTEEVITVYNLATSAVAANVYGQAKKESWTDRWVIDYEQCEEEA